MEAEIKKIREKVLQGTPEKTIAQEHPEFAKKTHFFKMLMKKDIDKEILDTLVVLMKGIQDGVFNEEYASVKFGEILVDKYVKDKVVKN